MTTDSAWEAWGKQDPYYGVITDPKFRKSALTNEAKQEFFEPGRIHAEFRDNANPYPTKYDECSN